MMNTTKMIDNSAVSSKALLNIVENSLFAPPKVV